jgi:hypothetical protein
MRLPQLFESINSCFKGSTLLKDTIAPTARAAESDVSNETDLLVDTIRVWTKGPAFAFCYANLSMRNLETRDHGPESGWSK